VPELGSLGSVRGALSNERPYREQGAPCRPLPSTFTGWGQRSKPQADHDGPHTPLAGIA
jgi:hypothetical protein